jgi:predicted nucleic acid-binding protein
MSADDRCYLDTSALAKWYLNEPGSEAFVSYLQEIDVAIISRLVATELRSLLARRRRMGEISQELESVIFATFQDDIATASLQLYPIVESLFDEAINLITRYPEHPLRTLDALHLAVARHHEIPVIATADTVLADTAETMGLTVRRF